MLLAARDGDHDLSTETMHALQVKYPTKDVARELALAHLWLVEHPKRRPKSIWRFVETWLKRAPAVRKPPPINAGWWRSDTATLEQGRAIGCEARPGEDMNTYRERIADRLRSAA